MVSNKLSGRRHRIKSPAICTPPPPPPPPAPPPWPPGAVFQKLRLTKSFPPPPIDVTFNGIIPAFPAPQLYYGWLYSGTWKCYTELVATVIPRQFSGSFSKIWNGAAYYGMISWAPTTVPPGSPWTISLNVASNPTGLTIAVKLVSDAAIP
jgi:hypothetical protein